MNTLVMNPEAQDEFGNDLPLVRNDGKFDLYWLSTGDRSS